MHSFLSVVIILFILQLYVESYQTVEPSKCKIYGPGVETSEFHMPVRYFFVELFDNDGVRLNKSAGEAFLLVENLNQSSCSIWAKVIDRHDGSYVVRYKLLKKCTSLKLAITTPEGRHLGKSPYSLEGPHYPESCNCPVSFDHWTKSMQCLDTYDQINDDLSSWSKRSIIFSTVLEDATRRWANHPGAYSFCHYVIVDNQISRKCYGEHVGFKMFSDAMLLSLTRKVQLPNTQFLVNLGDWPLEKNSGPDDLPIPMFSWCGSSETKDIVLPTYELTESTLEMMGRQTLDVMSAENFAKVPWEQKERKAFWRGRDSRDERLRLVRLSREHPDLLDAGITRFFFFRDRMDEFGPEVPTVGFEQFFKYKYQVTVDGTVAAYRLAYLLAGNGLVLKQDSNYYEHYYHLLKPWQHYVPIKQDLSDLMDRIKWAKEHDSEARKISRRAQLFVRKFLNPKEIFCYYARAIKDYTELLNGPPASLPTENGFERVEHVAETQPCHCDNTNYHQEASPTKPQKSQSSNDSDMESVREKTTKDEL